MLLKEFEKLAEEIIKNKEKIIPTTIFGLEGNEYISPKGSVFTTGGVEGTQCVIFEGKTYWRILTI